MKKFSIFLVLIVLAVGVYAMTHETQPAEHVTVSQSQSMTKEVREVGDFDKIEIEEGAFDVDVTYSKTEEVVVEATQRLQKHIKLNVKGGTLRVKIAKGTMSNFNGSFKIHIKTAKLNDFKLASASSVRLINTLKDNDLSIESSGAASFSGDVQVKKADIALNGAARVSLSGKVTDANLTFTGASQLGRYGLEVDNLDVVLTGASSAELSCSKKIEGTISGASSLTYRGNPTTKGVSLSMAATLNKDEDSRKTETKDL